MTFTTLANSLSNCSLISHSHKVTTLHPIAFNCPFTLLSLFLLFPSFSAQKSCLVVGIVDNLQPCECQKQPLMNNATLFLGKTMSGWPGNEERNLYLKPNACRAFLTSNSNDVLLDLILDIFQLRRSLLILSTASVSPFFYKLL